MSKLYLGVLCLGLLCIGILWSFNKGKPNQETTQPMVSCINSESKPLTTLENLEAKITVYEQKLKETSDITTKENLNQIINIYQKQKATLEKRNLWNNYVNILKQQIQELEKKLNNNTHKLTTKHALTTAKLTKEKELINLQEQEKLLTEEDEIENILLPDIESKLKNKDLKTDDKTKLEVEQQRLKNKLEESQQQIQKIIQKIKVIQEMNDLEQELATIGEDESLKSLLKTRQDNLKAQS